MNTRRTAALAVAILAVGMAKLASAQMPLPAATPPDGATLFKRQCATCHTLRSDEPARQGPPLGGVLGRRAGGVAGFHYSDGFAHADWTWDENLVNRWISNPQAMIPGTVMLYRQSNATTRGLIVAYLKTAG